MKKKTSKEKGKTSTERNRDRRERMKAAGFTNCSVYAHPEDHKHLRELARKMNAARQPKGKKP